MWFYDMSHDGFSLDDKRQRVPENDIPDILECWQKRDEVDFQSRRSERLVVLEDELFPLKALLRQHQATLHRLRFEEAMATDQATAVKDRTAAEAALSDLQEQVAPLVREMNQITRQFWVSKGQLAKNKYGLMASAYRPVVLDEIYLEDATVTLDRIQKLDGLMQDKISTIRQLLSNRRD